MYIEQPAGVGYSYCDFTNHPQDCVFDDNEVARDNLEVILKWFDKYPEFKNNDLYIAGESYGGIYVPYTTNSLYHYIQSNLNTGKFLPNLKGWMVGNGVTNWNYDTTPGYLEMAYWHSLYDSNTYEAMKELKCDFSNQDFPWYP